MSAKMISADKFFTFFVIPNQIKTFGVGFKSVCVYQHIHIEKPGLSNKSGFCFAISFAMRRHASKLPYIATASSTESSPLPTWNAATRICTVSGSLTPSTSGEIVRSAGTLPNGA